MSENQNDNAIVEAKPRLGFFMDKVDVANFPLGRKLRKLIQKKQLIMGKSNIATFFSFLDVDTLLDFYVMDSDSDKNEQAKSVMVAITGMIACVERGVDSFEVDVPTIDNLCQRLATLGLIAAWQRKNYIVAQIHGLLKTPPFTIYRVNRAGLDALDKGDKTWDYFCGSICSTATIEAQMDNNEEEERLC